MTTSRRDLLKGVAMAAILGEVGAIRRAAAAERAAACRRESYTLDPEVTYLNHASSG